MRRRLDPEDRRQEILRAAMRAFSAAPYDEVRLDEIARGAGASRALIYHYFGDKRGLFLAVVRSIVGRIATVVRTDLDLDAEEMVAANADAWLDFVAAGRQTSLALLGPPPFGQDPELEALQDELRDRAAERILANHLGEGEIPAGARTAMRAAIGLMERAAYDWATGRGGSREQTHAIVVRSILAVVRDVIPAVTALETERGAAPSP